MAKGEKLELEVKGLYTSPSTFSGVPEGAARVADNIVIDQPNIARSRRGETQYGTNFPLAEQKVITDYNNTLWCYTDDGKLNYDSDNNGTWVPYSGVYAPPDSTVAGSRIRTVESNRNLYFLTQLGTYKLDSLTGTPRLAGAPRGESGTATLGAAPGFLPIDSAVAYRVVWGYTDANNNLILGQPSERIVVANPPVLVNITGVTGLTLTVASTAGLSVGQTLAQGLITDTIATVGVGSITVTAATFAVGNATAGSTCNVNLEFQVPLEIDTTWFYQVYRSQPSATATTVPSDELQQTIEGVCTSGQITARDVTLTDRTPTSLLQGYLYTNNSQQGILQANTRPPFAMDACLYNGYVFYANTRTVHTLDVNLLATGAPYGLVLGDTLTFTRISDGATFSLTAAATESPAAGQFFLSLTGDPGVDLQATALSIAKICNTYPTNTWLAGYYVSDYNSIPGQLEFQTDILTKTGFYVNSSNTTAWTPAVTASGTTFQSQNELAANRVYWSKQLQPEAVPLGNWIEIGSKAIGIDRILALRDSVIVIKQDGVFRLSNLAPPFQLTGVDNTVRILAPNTAVALDNQIFFLSTQGVVAASDNDVSIMSFPIEYTLLQLTSPSTFPNVAEVAFAVQYSSDRKYILSLPTNGTDAFCSQQYTYNTITQQWTRWTIPSTCGWVGVRDNKLYLGAPHTTGVPGQTLQERKAYTLADYADEQYAISITTALPTQLTVVSAANLDVGMTVTQVATGSSDIITGISGSVLSFANASAWGTGAAIAYTPIACTYQTVQLDCGNSGIQKQFSETSFLFTETNFNTMLASFTTDLNGSGQTQLLTAPPSGSWGTFPWGLAPWGSNSGGGQKRIRTLVPNLSSRANWLYISLSSAECFTSFGLSGMSIGYNEMSSRQRQA